MKTIKEFKQYKTLTDGGKGYWQALEDVIKLIDERIKRLKIELEAVPRESRIRMSLVINEKIAELEELKSSIRGTG